MTSRRRTTALVAAEPSRLNCGPMACNFDQADSILLSIEEIAVKLAQESPDA